ncbi:MAG: sodium:proton antiporter [Acidobacteria bacterium]|nr:sodium:proton antiporter [Acidobacteriota bacterium]
MDFIDVITILITLAALFSYLNHRFIRLPTTIGLMLCGLVMSLCLIALGLFYTGVKEDAAGIIQSIDFNDLLLHGMLSFLLFAGALHININDLLKQKWIISALATVGIILSTFLVGGFTWTVLHAMDLQIPFVYCLVFGALISPTDPVAVLGILKVTSTPESLRAKITGESLFNDGVGVVLFIVLIEIATGSHAVTPWSVALIFLQESLGGIVFGFCVGWIAYRMLKKVDNYQVEVLITLALVMGGYGLANSLHISGPLAIVVAGLLIGNHGRAFAMSQVTRDHLDKFWELMDEIMNAVLFVLIGLEIVILTLTYKYILAGLLMIPLVLLARLISVGMPIACLRLKRDFSPKVVRILTWGGLRGGISVALALSIPPGQYRDTILAITYIIVVFSILVQGLTIKRLVA